MATKTDFSMQLGQPSVVGVDPSSAVQAIKLQGAATADALKMLGTTAYEAFAGYQAEGFKQEQTGVIKDLQSSMTSLKESDIVNKSRLEQSMARVTPEQESFRASSILAGADPEEARKNASIFAQEKEASIVTTYRTEQKRLAELRDQMPEKEKEAMLRSEVLLKNYITRYPGFANTFRTISQEVTGQKNLELYSVQQLYKDIDFIEKQKEAGAKAAAKAQEESQKAFVKDATTGGRMSETQALELYGSLGPAQRLKVANGQVNLARMEKDSEEELKKGGTGLQNFVTGRISTFRERALQASASVFSELKKVGITEEQMIGGNIPPEKRYDPTVLAALEKATQTQLGLLDSEFVSAQAELRKYMNKPVDAVAARQAESDLASWYKGAREDLIKNGVGKSLSAFSSTDDEKTMSARLSLVNTLQQTLGINPDVAQQFANPALAGEAKTKYPLWAAGLDHIEKMRRAALRGVPTPEWLDLQKQYEKITPSTPAVPKTTGAIAASVISYKNTGRELEDASQGRGVKSSAVVLPEFMNSSMANPDNNRDALAKYSSAIAETVRKLPASEKEVVLAQIKEVSNNYLYGAIGHGEAAKKTFDAFKETITKREKVPYSVGTPSVVFNDPTGANALTLAVTIKPDPTIANNPMKMGEFKRNADKFSKPADLNGALQTVDNNIRLRAIATGESVIALRKEFMTNFMKEGSLSANFTTLTAPTAASEQQPTTGAALVTPTPVGPLTTEKAAISAMQSGRQDLQREIQKLEASLADTKPGSATYKQLEFDLQEANKVLKGLK